MKVLLKAPGWSYEITEDDFLWMARAASGEGEPAHVIWTWMQRYASGSNNGIGNFRSSYPTLMDMVLAHSQPVNPKWRRDGEFCKPGGRYAGTARCAPNLLDRRDHMASLTWDQIPANVKSAINALRQANLPNPVPRAVDFADETVAAAYVSRNHDTNGAAISFIGPSGGRYVTTTKSRAWPDNYIAVELDGSCKWLLIGDSQAVGMKDYLAAGMRTRSLDLAASFANVGWSTVRTLTELGTPIGQAIVEHNPRLVIIVLGGNDMPNDTLDDNMRRLIELVRSGGASVVWLGPAHAIPEDIARRKAAVAEIQRAVVLETGISWLNSYEMTKDLTHTPDGVHFVRAGSQRWAERIVSALVPAPTTTLWGLLRHLTPFAAFLPLTKEGC